MERNVTLNVCSGEWKCDVKHGFGAYYYTNNDIYEGSWKENLRHGMGTYLYADTGTKFMGTWVEDCMEGPGQLIHARYCFHGFWKLNLVRCRKRKKNNRDALVVHVDIASFKRVRIESVSRYLLKVYLYIIYKSHD